MGGNNSKLNQNGGGEVLPARIRPLLRQRIEEFRRRRNNGVATVTPQGGGELEGAISKEQLLKNDAGRNSHSFAKNNGIEETQQQPPKEQRLVEKLSKVVPLPVSECEKDFEKKAEIIKSTVAAGPHPGNKANAKNGDIDDEKEKEDEEDDNETGRLIGPGSPSFKIYCIEAEKRKKEEDELRDDDEKEEQTTAVLHQKSPSTDSDESAASASEIPGYPNEVETTQKRKGNKIKKLGAMRKNLLNVKNMQKNRINRMMACTGNDRKSLLADNN